MKNQEMIIDKFKIEELEPRLEMGKWSGKAGSSQNWSTGEVTTNQEVSWSTK
ncbi:MAG: hypothetical protein ACOCWG_02440 [bacterium]